MDEFQQKSQNKSKLTSGNQTMIDLQSEEISYNQAKKIRQQIQKDVELLRNRVRMLQFEEEKALKKIQETKKKTRQILELKALNDKKFENQMRSNSNNRGQIISNQNSNYFMQKKLNDDIKKKQSEILQKRKDEVQNLKNQKQ